MIIDIRSHFKKIKKESELFSRKEIETQLKNAMSYFDIGMLMQRVSPKKAK